MQLNNIELFISVAKHKNLGDTAGELRVSASSVCQRLKCLEKDLGVKLYSKNRDGIELTDAGNTFLTTGSQVLDDLETVRQSYRQSQIHSTTILLSRELLRPR